MRKEREEGARDVSNILVLLIFLYCTCDFYQSSLSKAHDKVFLLFGYSNVSSFSQHVSYNSESEVWNNYFNSGLSNDCSKYLKVVLQFHSYLFTQDSIFFMVECVAQCSNSVVFIIPKLFFSIQLNRVSNHYTFNLKLIA